MRTWTGLLGAAVGASLLLAVGQAEAAPPIPMQFAKGSYGVMAQGEVTTSEPQQVFTLDVAAGQTLTISFAGAGPMRGSVQCQGNVADGPFEGTGNTVRIKDSGECKISVGANTMATPWTGHFTLAVLAYR